MALAPVPQLAQPRSIGESLGEMMQLKSAVSGMKIRDRQERATTKLGDMLKSGVDIYDPDNRQDVRANLSDSPELVMQLDRQLSSMDLDQLQMLTQKLQQAKVSYDTQLTYRKDVADQLKLLLGHSPESQAKLYPSLRAGLMKLDNPLAAELPDTFDETTLMQFVSETENLESQGKQLDVVAKQTDAATKAAAEARAVEDQTRQAELHDVTMRDKNELQNFLPEGKTPGTATRAEMQAAITAQAAAKRAPSNLTESNITVDGKEVKALKDDQGNYIDATTRQPITGKIGIYRPPPSTTLIERLSGMSEPEQDRVLGVEGKRARQLALARAGITDAPASIAKYAKSITDGTVLNASQIPAVIRGEALAEAVTQGGFFISQADKDALRKLSTAESIVDDLEYYIKRVQDDPTDIAALATLNGLREATAGVFAKGVFAEVGVLTDQDVGRVKAIIPGVVRAITMEETTRENIKELRSLISKAKSQYSKSPRELMDGSGGGNADRNVAPTDGVIRFERGPDGQPRRAQ